MSKKRAFVRYTKQGKLIPGSLIVTTSGGYPINGLYQEVPMDLCCTTTTTTTAAPGLRQVNTSYTGVGAGCVGKASPVTIYMSEECYASPSKGCIIYTDAEGTTPVSVNGDYLLTVSSVPGYITVGGGIGAIETFNPC